jgi:hypothetical protein
VVSPSTIRSVLSAAARSQQHQPASGAGEDSGQPQQQGSSQEGSGAEQQSAAASSGQSIAQQCLQLLVEDPGRWGGQWAEGMHASISCAVLLTCWDSALVVLLIMYTCLVRYTFPACPSPALLVIHYHNHVGFLTAVRCAAASFMSSTFDEEVVGQWVGRLQLSPEEVESLVGQQPALMEMAPTTVKARLVGHTRPVVYGAKPGLPEAACLWECRYRGAAAWCTT